jgi:HNH endonuclease
VTGGPSTVQSEELRSPCLPWPGAFYPNGYGRTRDHWRRAGLPLAHRLVWTQANGEIPVGLLILHRCNNPSCVNLEHLYLGDHAQNMRDRVRAKTHCKNGHALVPGNVRVDRDGRGDSFRTCLKCAREKTRRWRRRKLEGVSSGGSPGAEAGSPL